MVVGEDTTPYQTRADAPSDETHSVVSLAISTELDDSFRPEAREDAKTSVPAPTVSPTTRVMDGTVDSWAPILARSRTDSESSDAPVRK